MGDFIGAIADVGVFVGFLLFVLAGIGISYAGYEMGYTAAEDEAFKRGHMEYCKSDGSRVWVGECE